MKNKLIILVFCISISLGCTVLALPGNPDSVKSENRNPATFIPPTFENVKSGEFASNFEAFLGDNMWMRSELISASGTIARARGIENEFGKVVQTNKDIGTENTKKSSLLVKSDSAMEVFIRNASAEKKYIKMINLLEREFRNIKIYNMIVPTRLAFCEPVYSNIQDNQEETINSIYKRVNERVINIDTFDMLKENKDKYTYFNTDHHWTADGAYFGYCAFLKAASGDENWEMQTEAKENPYDIGEFENIVPTNIEKNVIKNFYGSLYGQADSPGLKPDEIIWYNTNERENITVKHSGRLEGKPIAYDGLMFDIKKPNYSVFMSGDHQLSVIENHLATIPKTILIIKDSYSNAFVTWLINNYHRIILLDPRAYKQGIHDVVEKYQPQEIMVMNYIFTSTFEDYSDTIIRLINK